MYDLTSLSEPERKSLINHCVRELNFVRHGNRTPFYLWERELKREVGAVLNAAHQFITGQHNDRPRKPEKNRQAQEQSEIPQDC